MIVRAIFTNGTALSEEQIDPRAGIDFTTDFELELGKTYVVYAIGFFLAQPWLYVLERESDEYPVWKPAGLFEVVDSRLSRYWQFAWALPHDHQPSRFIIAFREWSEDLFFYDRLTDRQPSELAIFKRYRELIDEEALQPLTESARDSQGSP